MTTSDVIQLVECAYALQRTDAAWLDAVNAAASPLLDEGLGCTSYTYRFPKNGRLKLTGFASSGLSPALVKLVRAWMAQADVVGLRRAHVEFGPAASTSEASEGALTIEGGLFAESFGPYGIHDVLGCRGLNGDSCIAIAAPRDQITRADHHFRTRWSQIAAHLGAGLRLREALAGASPLDALGRDDAVLDAGGRVTHAAGESEKPSAREKLRLAALSIDRARSSVRTHEDEALAQWRALVDGRWSLVDSFDSDGRRFIVARRNDEQLADPRGLSERESQVVALAAMGHTNRLVAYHLGLSKSTVATHLTHAMRKLGIASRLDLVRLFAD